MFKRVLSLILALIIVSAPLFGGAGTVSAAQTSSDDLEAIIAEQFDAYAKSLSPEGASEAVSRLVKHSIKNGGTLNMKANDKFSAGLLNSKLFRASFIHAATAALQRMTSYYEPICFMRGGISWYEHDLDYNNAAYFDNENGIDSDDERFSPSVTATMKTYEGAINSFDEGMMLVVGDSSSRFTFRQTEITRDTITYKVNINVFDRFDFNGAKYSGNDTNLADTLTWLGRLLSVGILCEFDWSVHAELTLTVPNSCTHQSNDCRWEFDGNEDLVSVANETYTINPLSKKGGTAENGVFSKTYYTCSVPIRLNHDFPWILEFRCAGNGSFAFSSSPYTSSGIYLRKLGVLLFFGDPGYLNDTDENITYRHYGINLKSHLGSASFEAHTYRLENRIFDDGSNMVYLFVDDIEIGPMNGYHHSSAYQGISDWISGKDFVFNYVGNQSRPFDNVSVDYIQVREDGENPRRYNYCTTSVKQPTCAEKGKTTYDCTKCGAVFSESIPMLEHDPVAIPGYAPTCTESGLSDGSKCNSCGKVLTEQSAIEPLGHSFADRVCTACGELEYDLGDVDLDGDVDVDDVLALLWHVLFPDEYKIEVDANFDGVGDVNVDDVLALLWHVLFPEEYPLN